MRDECLNEHLFFTMNHARAVIAGWTEDCNTVRPHSAIGYRTRAAYAGHLDPQRAPALRHSKAPRRCRSYRPADAQFSARNSDRPRMKDRGHVTVL
jgi:hypothetical protein